MMPVRIASALYVCIASVLCVCVAGLLASAPASAVTTYPALSGHFGEAGSGPGQLSRPTAMAVNQSTGDVYVVDTGNSRVEEFSATGVFIAQFNGSVGPPTGAFSAPEGIAVDNSGNALDPANGDVYVVDRGHNVVDQFTASGTYVGQFTEANGHRFTEGKLRGVAVDPTGNLWITSIVNAYEFGDTGSFEKELQRGGNSAPALGVDSSGDLFTTEVGNIKENYIAKIFPNGERRSYGPTEDSTLAVNPETDSLFVDQANRIVEYGPSGEALFAPNGSRVPVQTFATEGLSGSYGITLNAGAEGRFYASEREADQVEFFNAVIKPTPVGAPASALAETSATLNGAVDPEGQPVSVCRFEYGTTEAYGQSAPCEQSVGEGFKPVAVSAQLTGLSPNTVYHFRVAAANAKFGEAKSADGTFVTRGPLVVIETSVSHVASSSATLQALVNPVHDIPTTYYFQYGKTTAYEEPPVPTPPGAPLRSSEGEIEAAQHVHGLAPSTVYHYRFVGISEQAPGVFETVIGPDATFTTQGTQVSGLPDGRQWELVSPVNKHGALIEALGKNNLGNGGLAQAAVSGDAITYAVNAPTEAQPQGYANLLQVLSTRGPGGWSSRDLAVPHEVATAGSVGHGEEYRFFSEDLSLGVLQPFGAFIPSSSPHALAPGEASEQTAFLRTDFVSGNVGEPCVSSCYRPLVTGAPGYANVPAGTKFGEEGQCPPETECGPDFVGASPDASHVVLASGVALTSTAAPHGGLYEWSAAVPRGESLQLVSVLPNGQAVPSPTLGKPPGQDAWNAISSDGARIFFSDFTAGGGLYMRANATRPPSPLGAKGECTVATDACTVRLDVVQQGATGGGTVAPEFQLASRDGSRVFFTDIQALTSDSGSGGEALYECEMAEAEKGAQECKLSDLTPVSSGESAQVLGAVVGASEDGSWVYFVANGTLGGVPGAVHGTCASSGSQVAQTCNLYVLHKGESPKLVAVLSGADGADWASNLTALTARVSPNGRWLAFMSQRALTGYDNRDVISGKPDAEVFLYDAETNRLVCASCNPTGARPLGGEGPLANADDGYSQRSLAAVIPTWTPYRLSTSRYQSPYLSNSGRLFFNSDDALAPQDVNGTWDVYEYEPLGIPAGSRYECTQESATFSARAEGCIGLISSGGSAEESAYLGASENGGDVFFLTTAKLVAQDFDKSLDVYDAHECTSASPCFPPAATQPPPCVTADGCRAAPTPQPAIFGTPPSATFSGTGNVAPPSTAVVKPKAAPLTRAQKLTRALRACHRQRGGRRRACERGARRAYGGAARRAGHGKRGGR
jgi:hypothetical protein